MSDHRTVQIQTKEMDITFKSGVKVKITLTLQQSQRDADNNGRWDDKLSNVSIAMTSSIDGVAQGREASSVITDSRVPSNCAAIIGCVGLTQKRYDDFLEMKNQLEMHPIWVKKMQAENKAHDVTVEYAEGVDRIDNMMTLGGATG